MKNLVRMDEIFLWGGRGFARGADAPAPLVLGPAQFKVV